MSNRCNCRVRQPYPRFKVTNVKKIVKNMAKRRLVGMLEVTHDGLKFRLYERVYPVVWRFNTIKNFKYNSTMFWFETGQMSRYADKGVFNFETTEAKRISKLIPKRS